MKRLSRYLAIGLLVFSITGCVKERMPTDEGNSQSSLLGVWHPTRKVSASFFNGQLQTRIDMELDETNLDAAYGLHFISENLVAHMHYEHKSGRWQSGFEVEYFLSGDGTKIYVAAEDVETYKIIQLTEDEMVLLIKSPNNPYYPGLNYFEDQIYFKKSP